MKINLDKLTLAELLALYNTQYAPAGMRALAALTMARRKRVGW